MKSSMANMVLMAALVALAVDRGAGQTDPPDPLAAIMKVIKAFGINQKVPHISRCDSPFAVFVGGCPDPEVDIEGSTDWYRRQFSSYTALKLDFDMSPPEVISSTRAAKGVRLSTLVCPHVPGLSYSCQLDAAVIRGSASSTSSTKQWTVGGTTKQTFMYGVEFMGTGGKVGPTAQFSFAWSRNTGTVDTQTDQATNTGTQLLTVDPAKGSCYELTANMAKATQTGRSKLMAVYTGNVGFRTPYGIIWRDDGKDDAEFRLRSIWDIVRKAQAMGIPGANDFVPDYNEKFGYYVSYSNTFDTDFFLGSDGRGSNVAHASSSSQCAQMLPGGWESWLPPLDANSTAPQPGGRRLAGHVSVRLLPGSLRPLDGQGRLMAQPAAAAPGRRLRGAEPVGASPAKIWDCPDIVLHNGSQHGPDSLDNPTCRGAGFTAFQKELAAARRAAAQRQRHCMLAVKVLPGKLAESQASGAARGSPRPFDPSMLQRNHTLIVQRRGNACRVRPTPKAELDARDAAKAQAAASKPRAGEPGDYFSKIVKLVQALCFAQTGNNCDVDYTGTTDWYKRYFKDYKPVEGVAGADEIKMAARTDWSATSSSWYCAYADAATTCQAASADMTSKARTNSVTTAWNFQWKLGFKIKASASFLGIGPTAEYETENSVDWGYSFSDGSSTTETDGASTTATVRVPLTPAMNKCARIDIVTRKASAKGATRAWVCASGYVGTHQDPAQRWPDVDPQGETHFFRGYSLAKLVELAQRKNVNAGDAFDWYIDNQGRACLYNAVDMSFQQGVMSFVRPRVFDKDSPDCRPSALGISTAVLASTPGSANTTTRDAVPIPGMQDVPCDWETCGLN